MNEPLHVLHAVPDMNSGGIENYIMNMYRGMDRSSIQFDFLVHHSQRAFFDDEIESLGGSIFRLPVLDDKNALHYMHALSQLFSEHQWPIVHGHIASMAFFYLGAAERAGIPVRIAHSHGTSFLHTPKGYAKRMLFKGAKRHANVRLACSTEAGRYLFGDSPFYLAKNAIDSVRFSFNADARRRIRSGLGIGEETLVVGHVGRYNLQKNHSFLVNVFDEVGRLNEDSRLLLVGTGELEGDVRRQVFGLGIEDRVMFQNVTDEPEAFYSAMDVFVLPSLFEGLPLVGIEAQCNGLPCAFSSEITHEVAISDLAFFIDLRAGARSWAERIVDLGRNARRDGYASAVADHGFDIARNNALMTQFYHAVAKGGAAAVASILG